VKIVAEVIKMGIIVYSTPVCSWCVKVKEFLTEKGVEFESFDVSADTEKAKEMTDKSGQRGVPVTDINGKIIVGFDRDAIEAALAE